MSWTGFLSGGRGGAAAIAGLVIAIVVAGPRHAHADVRSLEMDVTTPLYEIDGDAPLTLGRFEYRLTLWGLTVGRARIDMRETLDAAGRALALDVLGGTHPAIDLFFSYRLQGSGSVRAKPFAPGGFEMNECENGRHRFTGIEFSQADDRVRALRGWKGDLDEYVFHSPGALDIPSTIFVLMNLDYEPGARFVFDTFTGSARYLVEVAVEGREMVRAGGATHDAWRLRVVTQELREADPEWLAESEREERHRETDVWLTLARPRELLRARSRTFIGSIGLELASGAIGLRDEMAAEARCL